MGCALEMKNKSELLRNIDAYVECAQFLSIAHTKDGIYKMYPRVKDKAIFNSCIKNKGGNILDEWVKEVKK